VYFERNEPFSHSLSQDGKPIFYGRLDKFDTIRWMVKVFQSDNYSIYRLNLPAAQIGYQHRAPTLRGKVLQGKFLVTP
jgi:hypothetical protein